VPLTACGAQANNAGDPAAGSGVAATDSGRATGAANRPEELLSCAGGKTVATTVDHDDTTKETRSPQDQAAAWASAQAGEFSGARKIAYESDERVDIAFTDTTSQVTAVLSYRNDGALGWRLHDAVSCP
jgi:hypothetical protein